MTEESLRKHLNTLDDLIRLSLDGFWGYTAQAKYILKKQAVHKQLIDYLDKKNDS